MLFRASIPQRLMRTKLVVPVDAICHCRPRLDEAGKVVLLGHSSLRLKKRRSTTPFCSGYYGVMNSWWRRWSRHAARKGRLWKMRPLSERITSVAP
jgi:hypothetical protein